MDGRAETEGGRQCASDEERPSRNYFAEPRTHDNNT